MTTTIDIKELIKGKEYYFYFHGFYLTGFFIDATEKEVKIENGGYFNPSSLEPTHVFGKGSVLIKDLLGIALC